MNLSEVIRAIPDFPKPGIMFRDITTMLKDPAAFAECVNLLSDEFKNERITKVVGIESRGFIFGAPVALALGAGFVPARKPGKLPAETAKKEYALEYGTDSIEIHKDALGPEDRVLIVDDLLATGGTAAAAIALVRELGATVASCAFVIELESLNGRAALGDCDAFSLLCF